MIIDTTNQVCHQKAMGSKTNGTRVFTVILNVYQSTGIEKEETSRQSLGAMGSLMKYEGSSTRNSRKGMTCNVI